MSKSEEKKLAKALKKENKKAQKKENRELRKADKKNKKESKRMSSIANRMNWLWIWRLFLIFLVLDAMLYVILGYRISRLTEFYTIFMEFNYLFIPVVSVQGCYLIFYALFGRRGIRIKLRPLYKMAYATQKLSEQTTFDESAFHDLEDAIEKFIPDKPDARLQTGNSDLQGLENAVNNLMDRMRDNFRQQSRFVSDASHELRTPISVIQGYVNMLDRWGTEDETVLRESIDAIKSESEHMKHLIEQLLFLARGDTGKNKLNKSIFSVNRLMKEVCDESRMIDSKHEYVLKLTDDEVYAVADEQMIKQMVRILVDNASKYSSPGETITLKTGKNSGVPFLTVQDEGVGISAEDAPHVFERFYRSDSSRTRETGGTGLGLSIAKWIIDKHEGYIDMVSREGIGTRITVNLPRR